MYWVMSTRFGFSPAVSHGLEFFQPLQPVADRAVVVSAQPALGDVGHAAPGGFPLDEFLGLALGADEEDQPPLGNDLRDVAVAAEQAADGFPEVNDVDQVALAVDVRPHLGVPTAGPVPVVDAGVEQFLDLNDGHANVSVSEAARPIWRER